MQISRRTVLAAAAVPLTGVAGACASPARTAEQLYVRPDGVGDGASWEEAASLRALDELLRVIKPGGEILIAADQGEYAIEEAIELTAGGVANAAVRVRGVAQASGEPMAAIMRGNRSEAETGPEGFRLLRGANHLHFSHFDFRAVGNGCFRVGAPLSGLTIEDCAFADIYRFLENTASRGQSDATPEGTSSRKSCVERLGV